MRFSESFDGTELFKGLSLKGEMVTGQPLELALTVNQAYPIPVHVACYYEDGSKLTDDQYKLAFEQRAQPIGDEVLPAATGRSPGDKVERRELTFRFSVPEPGDYFLACLTPAAPENGLGRMFTIRDPDRPAP